MVREEGKFENGEKMQNSISEIIKKEEISIQRRVDRLSLFSGFLLFATAFWCMWPIFSSNADPLKILTPAVIALLWVGIIPDLAVSNPTTRSRIGAASSVFWIPLAIIGSENFSELNTRFIGGILLISCSIVLLVYSRNLLSGEFKVVRYRSIMGLIGVLAGLSVLIPQGIESNFFGSLIVLIALSISINDWFGSDEQRTIRKEFKKKLDILEGELLIHRSKGRAVDQAASLVLSASQEGHIDPHYGIELLLRATDSMERSIRLSEDILEICQDTKLVVEEAEQIAPVAKRPRRTFIQAERELELGSLEEGEYLFRLAKKQANEICEWWEKAETTINESKRLLREHKGQAVESLESLLSEAITNLENENPRQAYEFALSIPTQLSSVEGNAEIAIEVVEKTKKKLKETEGLNLDLWNENLIRAEDAIEKGDFSLARGLAESILRQLELERESMDFIRKALQKRSKLKSKWKNLADGKEWDKRLKEVEIAADELEWSHAATLLQRLTESLESDLGAHSEANELLEFAKKEWSKLREKCDKVGIDLLDEERRNAEQFLAEASQAAQIGELHICLDKLGEADVMMEKLRRRV